MPVIGFLEPTSTDSYTEGCVHFASPPCDVLSFGVGTQPSAPICSMQIDSDLASQDQWRQP
jgi:hypothetical protein